MKIVIEKKKPWIWLRLKPISFLILIGIKSSAACESDWLKSDCQNLPFSDAQSNLLSAKHTHMLSLPARSVPKSCCPRYWLPYTQPPESHHHVPESDSRSQGWQVRGHGVRPRSRGSVSLLPLDLSQAVRGISQSSRTSNAISTLIWLHLV